MSKYNELSENDEVIKSLREKQTNNPGLKKSIKDKINILEGNKTILK